LSGSRSQRIGIALCSAIVSTVGCVSLLFIRAAQRNSNRRQLKKCNSVGARVVTGHGLEVDNHGFISIGDDVSICGRTLLSCGAGGSIGIGRNSFLGFNVIVASDRASISIGEDCLIAENVSIRAGNHGTKAGTLIRLQQNNVADISIGKDVWIGCGVAVLAGSSIADGCVIGANSVVRGETEPNSIYAGAPIRRVGLRGQE
jgi:acetyltransferase-like isoleucine patch superfamily enzyme